LQKADLSIIIVNYNSFDLTKNTIDSLKQFSEGFSYEIIIIDNASKDGSGEKLDREFPECKCILNEINIGFGPANNQGLKIAIGDHILFLNNDVLFVENTLKILLQYRERTKDKILMAPKLLNKDETVQHSVYSFLTPWLTFTTFLFLYRLFPRSKYFNRYYLMNRGISEITHVETVTGAFMLFNREDILELNGFDEDFFFYGEDNDLCKRFRAGGGKVVYYPLTKIIHLKGGSPKTDWFHESNNVLSLMNLFNKHYPFPKRVLAYILLYIGNILRALILLFKFLFTMKKKYLREAILKIKTLNLSPGRKK